MNWLVPLLILDLTLKKRYHKLVNLSGQQIRWLDYQRTTQIEFSFDSSTNRSILIISHYQTIITVISGNIGVFEAIKTTELVTTPIYQYRMTDSQADSDGFGSTR